MPQSYISAEWITDEVMGNRIIKAIGDDGSVWWIPEVICDVPPWPEFLETDTGKAFLTDAGPTNPATAAATTDTTTTTTTE